MDTHFQGPVSSQYAVGNSVGAALTQRGFPILPSNGGTFLYLCTIMAQSDLPILLELDGFVETAFDTGSSANPTTLVIGNGTTANAYLTSGIIVPTTTGWQKGTRSLLRAQTDIYALLTDTGVPATGTITSNGTNVTATDTVTVGATTYTFVSTIGATNGNVLKGSSTAASLANLVSAINFTTGEGTTYIGTAANASATAAVSGNVITVTAIVNGYSGNTVALSTVNAGTLTVSGATLAGGVPASNGLMEIILRATGYGKGPNIAT
jgi:hypothetical protein